MLRLWAMRQCSACLECGLEITVLNLNSAKLTEQGRSVPSYCWCCKYNYQIVTDILFMQTPLQWTKLLMMLMNSLLGDDKGVFSVYYFSCFWSSTAHCFVCWAQDFTTMVYVCRDPWSTQQASSIYTVSPINFLLYFTSSPTKAIIDLASVVKRCTYLN